MTDDQHRPADAEERLPRMPAEKAYARDEEPEVEGHAVRLMGPDRASSEADRAARKA